MFSSGNSLLPMIKTPADLAQKHNSPDPVLSASPHSFKASVTFPSSTFHSPCSEPDTAGLITCDKHLFQQSTVIIWPQYLSNIGESEGIPPRHLSPKQNQKLGTFHLYLSKRTCIFFGRNTSATLANLSISPRPMSAKHIQELGDFSLYLLKWTSILFDRNTSATSANLRIFLPGPCLRNASRSSGIFHLFLSKWTSVLFGRNTSAKLANLSIPPWPFPAKHIQ